MGFEEIEKNDLKRKKALHESFSDSFNQFVEWLLVTEGAVQSYPTAARHAEEADWKGLEMRKCVTKKSPPYFLRKWFMQNALRLISAPCTRLTLATINPLEL